MARGIGMPMPTPPDWMLQRDNRRRIAEGLMNSMVRSGHGEFLRVDDKTLAVYACDMAEALMEELESREAAEREARREEATNG